MYLRIFILAGVLVGPSVGPVFAQDATAQDAIAQGAASFHHHCDGCHTIDPAEGDGNGPNLATIMGRKAGTMPGFEYSRAMRESGIVWDPEAIAQFVAGPSEVVPGNKMAVTFKGIPTQEIPGVIAFLQSKSVAPDAAAIPPASAPPASAPPVSAPPSLVPPADPQQGLSAMPPPDQPQ